MKTDGSHKIKHGTISRCGKFKFWAYVMGKEYWPTVEKFEHLKRRLLENKRKRYAQNPRLVLDKDKIYRERDRDKYLKRARLADAKRSGTPKRKAWQNLWVKNKKKSDASYAVSCRLRIRLASALKRAGGKKFCKTEVLVGCSWAAFCSHIESLFTDGMGWHNRGLWHIDHIIPCVSFDLTREEEQKRCFNFKNLRPLWAKDNMIKGARIENYGIV